MDGATLLSEIEESMATELDRLGSEKLLLALTGADLETGPVLAAAAAGERAAAETFHEWATDEPNAAAREAFAAAAAGAEDRHDRITAAVPDGTDPGDPGPAGAALAGREETIERAAAGLLAWPLVQSRVHRGAVSFFINEADAAMADRFRDLRAETEALADDGAALLGELPADDPDWERAREAAAGAVRAAYEDYAATLEGMGLDPRPIC